MKNKFSLLLLVIAVSFAACDKIKDTRENTTQGTAISSDAVLIGNDTLVFPADATPAKKRVLVEEFTGHFCGTCPPAAIILYDSLHNYFGDDLITMAIHSGNFADTCPTALDCPGGLTPDAYTVNYRSDYGDHETILFGVTTNPIGMVDRVGYPTTHKKTSSSWKAAIQAELAITPIAKMELVSKYDASTRTLKSAVRTTFTSAQTDSIRLQMIVVEDSIVNWQTWYSHNPVYVPDYLFHDVVRASFNGLQGDIISSDVSAAVLTGYSVTLSSVINEHHCKVIAFLYRESDYRVLQAVQKSIE